MFYPNKKGLNRPKPSHDTVLLRLGGVSLIRKNLRKLWSVKDPCVTESVHCSSSAGRMMKLFMQY
jgi:hypothetical protein